MQRGAKLKRLAISEKAKELIHLRRGKEALKGKCGDKAFLMPEELKFPIVSPFSKDCEPDCKMIHAAYTRARQWKYDKVAEEAEKLYKEHGCEKKLGIKIHD